MAPSSQIMMSKDDAFPLAMALSVGSAPFMVLRAVVELDVFDIIDRAGPGAQLSPTQIAANLPTTNPDATASMLDRMLRLLTTYSMLSCSVHFKPEDGRVERLYGLNPVSQFFVKKEGLGSFVLFMSDKVHMNAWYQLKDAVLDGSSAFYNTYGMRLFQFHEKDDRSNLVFNNAISSFSAILTKKMLEIYKGFEGISTLVDVGGGIGTVLNMIVSKYPAIKGINLDLQHVIINAPTYDGVEQVAGDMFKSIPKGDAIFMKWICHDWSDELCIKLLKNCHTALSNNGKVIIFDYILAMAPEASNSEKMASCFDVLMLASTEGGKERTEQEFETLAKQTGFEDFRVACSVYDMKVMELLKKN